MIRAVAVDNEWTFIIGYYYLPLLFKSFSPLYSMGRFASVAPDITDMPFFC